MSYLKALKLAVCRVSGKALVVIVVLGFALSMTTARAQLVERDLNSIDDGLLTFDTATGLEWLDLTATLQHSVNEILGGFGGYVGDGFRYATTDELRTLFIHGDIVDFDLTSPGNWQGAMLLKSLLGVTKPSSTNNWSEGFVGINEPGVGEIYRATLFTGTTFSQGASACVTCARYSFNVVDDFGSFLVRTTTQVSPIPEPEIYAMMGLGLGLLGWVGRRKRLQAA